MFKDFKELYKNEKPSQASYYSYMKKINKYFIHTIRQKRLPVYYWKTTSIKIVKITMINIKTIMQKTIIRIKMMREETTNKVDMLEKTIMDEEEIYWTKQRQDAAGEFEDCHSVIRTRSCNLGGEGKFLLADISVVKFRRGESKLFFSVNHEDQEFNPLIFLKLETENQLLGQSSQVQLENQEVSNRERKPKMSKSCCCLSWKATAGHSGGCCPPTTRILTS